MSESAQTLSGESISSPSTDATPPSGAVRNSFTERLRNLSSARGTFRAVVLITVVPIFVDAIRQGFAGWVPANDTAATVLRAKYALGAHPSLVGMYSAAGSVADTPSYFPGPWQLWWLWGPIRVLGTTWGPLLAMAVLNAFWIVLAGWCVKRRLGYRTAIAAIAFLGVLNWSLGSGILHDATPMIMIVPPFAAFLFVAWALAAGDEGVLPAVALLANFLVLDHLVLTLLVPTIGLAALVIWATWLIHTRRVDHANWPELRRRSLRSLAWALAITVVAWIPPIVQQIRHDPGNLTNLWRAAGTQAGASGPASGAFATLISLFSRWPFWLRGSLGRSMNTFTGGVPATSWQIAVGVMLLIMTVALALAAIRRRDRAALTVLALAVVAFGAAYKNMRRAPTIGISLNYYLSTWPVAMFISFAVAFALFRTLPAQIRGRAPAVIVGLAVIAALATIPHTDFPTGLSGGNATQVAVSRKLNPQVVDAVHGLGPVGLSASGILAYSPMVSLALALDNAHIPICIPGASQLDRSLAPPCAAGRPYSKLTVYLIHANASPPSDSTMIARVSVFTAADRRELDALTKQVRAAVQSELAADRPITLKPQVVETLRTYSPDPSGGQAGEPGSNSAEGTISTAQGLADLADGIGLWHHFATSSNLDPAVAVDLPGITDTELLRWSELMTRRKLSAYVVALRPAS